MPLEKVLLVFNGEVIEAFFPAGDRTHFESRKAYTVKESGWYHLRAEGKPEERFPLDALYAQAFTNPVWIQVGDEPIRSKEAADYSIKWIERLHELIKDDPGWRSQAEKDHVFGQFEEAKAVYRKLRAEAR